MIEQYKHYFIYFQKYFITNKPSETRLTTYVSNLITYYNIHNIIYYVEFRYYPLTFHYEFNYLVIIVIS